MQPFQTGERAARPCSLRDPDGIFERRPDDASKIGTRKRVDPVDWVFLIHFLAREIGLKRAENTSENLIRLKALLTSLWGDFGDPFHRFLGKFAEGRDAEFEVFFFGVFNF